MPGGGYHPMPGGAYPPLPCGGQPPMLGGGYPPMPGCGQPPMPGSGYPPMPGGGYPPMPAGGCPPMYGGGHPAMPAGANPGYAGCIGQGGMQRCFKCQGHGFAHDSTMDHDAPHGARCFFCKDCQACGSSGCISGGPSLTRHHGVVTASCGKQACFKCEGRGFAHDSSMDHDKPHGERCFFCKDCDSCGGSGAIDGGSTTVVPGAYGGATVFHQGPQPCFVCSGKGFSHQSSMPHDKACDERCFFCEDCNACGGKGAV